MAVYAPPYAYDNPNNDFSNGSVQNVNGKIDTNHLNPAKEYVDDDGKSKLISSDDPSGKWIRNSDISYDGIDVIVGDRSNSLSYKSIIHSANLFNPDEIDRYNKLYRYGLLDPYNTLAGAREYLFFTKPDLHIMKDLNENLQNISRTELSDGLADIGFWINLLPRKDLISALQYSYNKENPFNFLLQNQCKSTLEIGGTTAEMYDTPSNIYGTNFKYRGSSEASDDNPEFSLEFKDTRYLDVYTYFKAYDDYEMLKHHGIVRPSKYYITNRILHDQFSIYKFIVAEDTETIIYFGKMYGVTPTSVPREIFSDPSAFNNDGINFSVNFSAAFYEDMRPEILADFNKLSINYFNSRKYTVGVYNRILDKIDNRPVQAAYVVVDKESAAARKSPLGYIYKLKWKGSDYI